MAYDIYARNDAINSIKVGQIYIANPSASIMTHEEFKGKEGKSKLHASGTFTVRPVLVVREPELWDKYTTVSIVPSTTKDVPGLKFTAGTNVYTFKMHDVRTVCSSTLLRLIGALSPMATSLSQAIISAFYGANELNAKSRLDDLRRFVNNGLSPEMLNDVRNIYEMLYTRYAHVVSEDYAPDWRSTAKTMDNYNQIHSYGYYGSVSEALPPKMSQAPVEEAKPAEIAPAPAPVAAQPVQAPQPLKKSGHQQTLRFLSSPNTRAWKYTSVVQAPISQWYASALYLSGFVTCDSMSQKFGESRYKFDKASKTSLRERFPQGDNPCWSVDSDMYAMFRSWWKDNNLEAEGYFRRDQVEPLFPLIRDILVTHPLTEAKVPCSEEARFYIDKFTLCEIIEIVPLLSTTKLAELTGARMSLAKVIKEYCQRRREIHLQMTDTVWDEVISSMRLYITPGNLLNLPKWLRPEFLKIPVDKLRDYCDKIVGWERADFNTIYNNAVNTFKASAK